MSDIITLTGKVVSSYPTYDIDENGKVKYKQLSYTMQTNEGHEISVNRQYSSDCPKICIHLNQKISVEKLSLDSEPGYDGSIDSELNYGGDLSNLFFISNMSFNKFNQLKCTLIRYTKEHEESIDLTFSGAESNITDFFVIDENMRYIISY